MNTVKPLACLMNMESVSFFMARPGKNTLTKPRAINYRTKCFGLSLYRTLSLIARSVLRYERVFQRGRSNQSDR